MNNRKSMVLRSGFTLIELAIVLVIIGLIVGGILVGQDLIRSAGIRAQVTQIEKYNQAANTFKGKYGGLPGDLIYSSAIQFGFTLGHNNSCNGVQGGRDGNGLLDGEASPIIYTAIAGEMQLFWDDLSSVNLIAGGFPAVASELGRCDGGWWADYDSHFPRAVIGYGNYIYVYEANGINWYGMSAITSITLGDIMSSPTLPVNTAYAIDTKMDDGVPKTCNVVTIYINQSKNLLTNAPNATSASSTTCYDTTSNQYSITVNQGAGTNCALSFKMQ